MRLSFLFFCAVLASSSFVLPPVVQAQQVTEAGVQSDIPLMVIRFNQRRVFYEKPLYTAVSRAVATKPNVMFDVVSFVPGAANSERATEAASAQVNAVVGAMRQMGVPANQIRVNQSAANDARFHEIYIYVQ